MQRDQPSSDGEPQLAERSTPSLRMKWGNSIVRSVGDAEFTTAVLVRRLAAVLFILCTFWLVFYSLSRALPYIKNGADLIYENKIEIFVTTNRHFWGDQAERVVIFGNSQILTGFVPALFDQGAPETATSLNLGLPDTTKFVIEYLRAMIRAGQVPTHVLLTLPWANEEPQFSPINVAGRDLEIMDQIFPFRHFFDNLLNFLMRAPHFGGLVKYYNLGEQDVKQMISDRGYYFIRDYVFPDQISLPDDFERPTDTPNLPMPDRHFDFHAQSYTALLDLARRFHIKVVIVPVYARLSQFLQNPITSPRNLDAFERPDGTVVVRAQYVTLDNRYFVDPAHLNPDGAAEFTNYLVRVFTKNHLWRSDVLHFR